MIGSAADLHLAGPFHTRRQYPTAVVSRRNRAAAVTAVLVFVVSLAGVGTAPAQASFPGRNGRIVMWDTVFGNFDQMRNQVFTVRRDGRGRRQLTHRGHNDGPMWGPFGHRIAYVHDGNGRPHVWMMGAHGGNKRRLTGGRLNTDWAPAWAPGGRRIVFVRSSGRRSQDLMVYSFRTKRATPLGVGEGFNLIPESPSWSLDGRTIAFSASSEAATTPDEEFPQRELFTVRANGTELTQVTRTPNWFEEVPNWSPNGRRLVYLRSGGPNFCEEINTIKPDGTRRVRVRAGCHAHAPVWAPNGHRILAYLGRTRSPGLWTMSPTGAHKRFVASAGGGDWQPLAP